MAKKEVIERNGASAANKAFVMILLFLVFGIGFAAGAAFGGS